MAWYNASWGFRKQITIQNEEVNADEVGFPVLINLTTDNDIKDEARADGFDILFTSSDEVTKLDHEIELYVTGTGQLVAWVSTPLSSAVDTILYLYYGNAGAGDQSNPEAVWDSNYKAVWHLDEDAGGTGTANLYTDSTTNDNDGDDFVSDNGKSGKIGKGQQFDGNNDYILVPNTASLQISSSITVELWMQPTVTYDSGNAAVTMFQFNGQGAFYQGHFSFIVDSEVGFAGQLQYYLYDNGAYPMVRSIQASWTGGVWYHVIAVFDDVGNTMTIYVDGAQNGQEVGETGNPSYTLGQGVMGARGDAGGGWWYGLIDELRISNMVRDADWIATQYSNQDDPSNFYELGAEVAKPVAGWAHDINAVANADIAKINNVALADIAKVNDV